MILEQTNFLRGSNIFFGWVGACKFSFGWASIFNVGFGGVISLKWVSCAQILMLVNFLRLKIITRVITNISRVDKYIPRINSCNFPKVDAGSHFKFTKSGLGWVNLLKHSFLTNSPSAFFTLWSQIFNYK